MRSQRRRAIGDMKVNRLVNWFWNSFVKNNDAKNLARQTPPDFDDAILDVSYLNDGHKLHTLNVYRPKGANGKIPVIFDVHGGGWYYGDKEFNANYCKALVQYGFAVVDISYRLAPEANIFEQISDVCAAIEYSGQMADEFGIDMQNAFMAGDSAGGHIVALIANIASDIVLQNKFGVVPKIAPKAVGLICPALEPLEIVPLPKSSMRFYYDPIFGENFLKNGIADLVSFKSILTADMCPCFLISAYGDFIRRQTLNGYKLLNERGIEAKLFYFEKNVCKQHKLIHVFNVLNWDWEESQMANRAMCEFFKSKVN